MSGLDKIKSQILEDARTAAEEKITRVREEADAIIAKAEEDTAAESARSAQQSEEAVRNYAQRIQSACDMQRRKALLAARQELIADVLAKAYERVLSLPEEEYFSMLLKVLEQYVQPETGEMYLSAADLARMPKGFETEVKKIAGTKGGGLTVSGESKEMDGGFVLVYGGIEENCTIRAMFAAKHDEWSDLVQKILF